MSALDVLLEAQCELAIDQTIHLVGPDRALVLRITALSPMGDFDVVPYLVPIEALAAIYEKRTTKPDWVEIARRLREPIAAHERWVVRLNLATDTTPIVARSVGKPEYRVEDNDDEVEE